MMSHSKVLILRILKYLFEEDTNKLITQKKEERTNSEHYSMSCDIQNFLNIHGLAG